MKIVVVCAVICSIVSVTIVYVAAERFLRRLSSGMNCFNVIESGVARVGKRAGQWQKTYLQSYIFEKGVKMALFGNFAAAMCSTRQNGKK